MNLDGRLTKLEKLLGWRTSDGDRVRTVLESMPTVCGVLEGFPEVLQEVMAALEEYPDVEEWGLVGTMPLVFTVLERHPRALEAVKRKVRSPYPASG